MGKNNKNRNNNNRAPKYTGNNVNPLGDTYRMKRHAEEVFRDMSRGRYNFNNISEFMNDDFVNACIKCAEEKIRTQNIYLTALNYTYANSSDPMVTGLKNQHQITLSGWYQIYNTMCGFTFHKDMGTILGLCNSLSTNRELRL